MDDEGREVDCVNLEAQGAWLKQRDTWCLDSVDGRVCVTVMEHVKQVVGGWQYLHVGVLPAVARHVPVIRLSIIIRHQH